MTHFGDWQECEVNGRKESHLPVPISINKGHWCKDLEKFGQFGLGAAQAMKSVSVKVVIKQVFII